MRPALLKFISPATVIIMLVAALAITSPEMMAARASITPQASVVVFAVSGTNLPNALIEPILIVENGSYTEPISGSSDAADISKFSDQYYRKGQKYRLLFGGGDAGAATVTASGKDNECMRTSAEVTLKTQARLNRNVMALATNSDSLGTGKGSRRVPTAAERASAIALAQTAFRQKGVAAALLPSLAVINLTALDLDRDGKSELIGSFVVKKTKGVQARHMLFLVAEPQGANFTTALAEYEQTDAKSIMSGADISAVEQSGVYVERLLDQLDLDGNGTGEVLTITAGLEGDSYKAYKKSGGQWAKVYEFGNYRCAF
jgi:hypothetical protein